MISTGGKLPSPIDYFNDGVVANKRDLKPKIDRIASALEECFNEAPIDFLGTGSNSNAADKKEAEWVNKWTTLLNELKDLIK